MRKKKKKKIDKKPKIKKKPRSISKRLLIFSLVAFSVLLLALFYTKGNESVPASSSPKAAIIDGLSVDFPNQYFIKEAMKLLMEAGYEVDLYNGSRVTVGLYQKLPQLGYDLIILRVHAAPMDEGGGTALFTAEPVNGTAYILEQFADWVRRARTVTGNKRYFAVTPDFIFERMSGEFEGTVIIVSSCFGMLDNLTGQAFLFKGASAYVGWNGFVSVNYTDTVILEILRHLKEGTSIEEAVSLVRENMGPDPDFGSELLIMLKEGSKP